MLELSNEQILAFYAAREAIYQAQKFLKQTKTLRTEIEGNQVDLDSVLDIVKDRVDKEIFNYLQESRK